MIEAMSSGIWPMVPWGVVFAATLAAAVIDLRTCRIPNLLTFPLLLAGLIYATLAGGFGWAGLGGAFLGVLVVGGPFVLLFILGGMGAGDAKLMGAVGAWLGVGAGLPVLAAVFICGGVLAIAYAVIRGQAMLVGRNTAMLGMGAMMAAASKGRNTTMLNAAHGLTSRVRMPYGVSIFVGVCVGGVWSWPWG